MKKINILITGGALSNNEGTVAMTIVAGKICKKHIPDANITIITTYDVDEDNYRNKYKYNLIKQDEIINLIIEKYLSLQFITYKNLYNKIKLLKSYWSADLIIDVSGDGYSDLISYFWSFIALKELIYPIIFHKPIIIFPQSLGPFKSKFTYNFAKFIFNHCKVIIAREEITKKLLDGMKLKTRVELIDDCAFLLKPVSGGKLSEIMIQENINKDKMLIGVSLSESIANYSKAGTKVKYEEYLQKMTNFVNYLTGLGRVVLISHVGGEANKINDDLIISEKIYNKAKNKDKIIFINKRYRPDEWKGIISLCDIFIGARMHANIAALSTNVPTIAIAYSHKFYGIMDRYGQSKYICDINKFNENELIQNINELLSNKKEIIEVLKKKNATLINNEKILSSIIKEYVITKK